MQDFIKAANSLGASRFRLPTETEWEYACRSGGGMELYSGGKPADEVAWYGGNRTAGAKPVAQKIPNALNLYDMSGNVMEWTLDIYDGRAYEYGSSKNPVSIRPGAFRTARGGGWGSYKTETRCGYRSRISPHLQLPDMGFRLVWEAGAGITGSIMKERPQLLKAADKGLHPPADALVYNPPAAAHDDSDSYLE